MEAKSTADLQAAIDAGKTVALFWAQWHPGAAAIAKSDLLSLLAADHEKIKFLKVDGDELPELVTKWDVPQVPTAVLFANGAKVDTLVGVTNAQLVARVESFATQAAPAPAAAAAAPAAAPAAAAVSADLETRLKELVSAALVMLFMKGSKTDPFCKFSRQMLEILEKEKCEYATFDILQDEEVRAGLKEFSNWPTFPQLYVGGKLVGGVDIVKEMAEDGSLSDHLPDPSTSLDFKPLVAKPDVNPLHEKLKGLITKEQVMLFMKGDPEGPKCGFSNTIVGLLRDQGIKFGYFDILSDEEVRQGLKEYSNWPTFPQLYSNGQLVGGLDIIKELVETDSLKEEMGLA